MWKYILMILNIERYTMDQRLYASLVTVPLSGMNLSLSSCGGEGNKITTCMRYPAHTHDISPKAAMLWMQSHETHYAGYMDASLDHVDTSCLLCGFRESTILQVWRVNRVI